MAQIFPWTSSRWKKLDKSRNKTALSQYFLICGILKFAVVWNLWCYLTLQRFQLCVNKLWQHLRRFFIFPAKFGEFWYLGLKLGCRMLCPSNNVFEVDMCVTVLTDGSLGLFRWVQPYQHRGVVRGRSTDPLHPLRPRVRSVSLRLWGSWDPPRMVLRHVHNHEPRYVVPYKIYD